MVCIPVKKCRPLLIYGHQSQILVSILCLHQAFVFCSDYIICLEVMKLFVEQMHHSIYLNCVTKPCAVPCNTCFIILRGNALN